MYLVNLIISMLIICGNMSAYADPAFHKDKYAALIVNSDTGVILHQENANLSRYPASLTKMMTLYLAFEAISNKRLSFDSKVRVSANASKQPRTNLALKMGEEIKIRDAVMGCIVRSANDAAVVLAEAVSGSEGTFAKLMTRRAKDLGMSHTTFQNASGLPHLEQKTSAYDMAKLAIALRRDFPQYYTLFSKTSFIFRGTKYESHNRVVKHYPGADGLKTGFVNASGFNLVTSAKRGNKKLVGIVMGGPSSQIRDYKMMNLLDRYFESPTSVKIAYNAPKVKKVSSKKKHLAKSNKPNIRKNSTRKST